MKIDSIFSSAELLNQVHFIESSAAFWTKIYAYADELGMTEEQKEVFQRQAHHWSVMLEFYQEQATDIRYLFLAMSGNGIYFKPEAIAAGEVPAGKE